MTDRERTELVVLAGLDRDGTEAAAARLLERDPDVVVLHHDLRDLRRGRVHRRLTKLISVRQRTPEFAGNALIPFHTPHAGVVGFQRVGAGARVLVVANVGDGEVTIDPLTLSGFERALKQAIREVAK